MRTILILIFIFTAGAAGAKTSCDVHLQHHFPAEIFVGNSSKLYARKAKPEELAGIHPQLLPEAFVTDHAVSAKSLAALQKFVRDAEKYSLINIYPTYGPPGEQVGNGMTGDRIRTTLNMKVTFDEDSQPHVDIQWRSTEGYLRENWVSLAQGFEPQDIRGIAAQHQMILDRPQLKKAFQELAETEIRDIVRIDPSQKEVFLRDGGKTYMYINMIQYYGCYSTLPGALKDQITRWSADSYNAISMDDILRFSESGRSTGGGWHTDGAEMSIMARLQAAGWNIHPNIKRSFQSLFVISADGVIEGGGTAVRVRPKDPTIPYHLRPFHERIVARFRLQNGQKGTFAPNIGTQAFDHMAEVFRMACGGSRAIIFVRVNKNRPYTTYNPAYARADQFEQERRSLILPE